MINKKILTITGIYLGVITILMIGLALVKKRSGKELEVFQLEEELNLGENYHCRGDFEIVDPVPTANLSCGNMIISPEKEEYNLGEKFGISSNMVGGSSYVFYRKLSEDTSTAHGEWKKLESNIGGYVIPNVEGIGRFQVAVNVYNNDCTLVCSHWKGPDPNNLHTNGTLVYHSGACGTGTAETNRTLGDCNNNCVKTISVVQGTDGTSCPENSIIPPANLKMEGSTIKWDGVASATSYALRIKDLVDNDLNETWSGCNDAGDNDFCNRVTGTSKSDFSFTSGHTYEIWVYAANDNTGCNLLSVSSPKIKYTHITPLLADMSCSNLRVSQNGVNLPSDGNGNVIKGQALNIASTLSGGGERGLMPIYIYRNISVGSTDSKWYSFQVGQDGSYTFNQAGRYEVAVNVYTSDCKIEGEEHYICSAWTGGGFDTGTMLKTKSCNENGGADFDPYPPATSIDNSLKWPCNNNCTIKFNVVEGSISTPIVTPNADCFTCNSNNQCVFDAGCQMFGPRCTGIGSACPTPTTHNVWHIYDLDNNGTVDIFDFRLFRTDFISNLSRSDFNNDGVVDIFDFRLFRQAFNSN